MPSLTDSGTVQLAQRVYLHGFPKSGLHLAETFVRQVAAPVDEIRWFGNIQNAWTCQFTNQERVGDVIEAMPAGAYIKGHAAYRRDWAEMLWDNCITTIFVYRDLRDVAVSQAHHVLDKRKTEEGDEILTHPGKAEFQRLSSFDDVLYYVITGLNDWPGLIPRWEMYSPWLDEKWVLPVRFEELRYQPHETAVRIIRYIGGMTAGFWGLSVTLNRDDVEETARAMVEAASQRKTVTFRKGKSGGWMKHWTPRIADAWQATGGDEWIAKLEANNALSASL